MPLDDLLEQLAAVAMLQMYQSADLKPFKYLAPKNIRNNMWQRRI